ncbi:hypothetical protein [Clostridium beijerinckii]|uniref:hypothetical protein n=1 Tax=Clostridium beijerinckii TaxID=1520 RepID=UPI00098BFBDE|nr:hypothetical protein [Clostridium beijerinckii]NRT78138.1 hypothetical protein [Clostridium beijerinckii]OOM44782.1 hypothetical protein CBEIJ_35280 [Clostridium beijerinckii]
MDINKKVKEFKIKNTVIQYKKTIIDAHEKQLKFAEELTNEVYNNRYQDKVDVIVARCGMGKSVIIKALLNNLVNNYRFIGKVPRNDQLEPYGAIVITDNLYRLEEIMQTEGLIDRCYLFKGVSEEEIETNCRISFKDKIQEQFKYPVLLITTQKYFKMSAEERQFMYIWAKGKREVAFIDEKPMLTNEDIVNEKFLSEIKIALDCCREGTDKDYLLETFEKIYSDLSYIRKNYSSQYDTMWIKKSKETLLINADADKKFFEVLANNVSRYIFEKVKIVQRIYSEGCLFVNKKDEDQDNTRQLIVLNDNSDKFDLDKCKYFVLDATAFFDIDYTIDKDLFRYVPIDDKKEKSDINLYHVPFTASQRVLKNNPKAIEAVCKFINETCGEDVFVSTYGKKKGLYQKFVSQLNTKDVAYYGAIKGKNDWNDKDTMVHVGFNRQADTVYLLTYLYINMHRNLKSGFKWNESTEEEIKNKIDELLAVESTGADKGMFKELLMNHIMRSKIIVDSEQNIMRIKCRHFSNESICNVYVIAGNSYFEYINRLCDRLNATKFTFLPEIFEEFKTDNRKPLNGKEKTNPQILKECLKGLEKGTVVKMKDIIELSGLNRNQIKECKKSNTYIKNWFDEHKGDKNGSYVA